MLELLTDDWVEITYSFWFWICSLFTCLSPWTPFKESICSKYNEKQEEISVWEMLYSQMTWLWLLSCSKEAFLRSLSLNHVQEVEDAQIPENGGATTARVIFSAKIRNTHIQEIHMQLRSSAYFLVSCWCCLNPKGPTCNPFRIFWFTFFSIAKILKTFQPNCNPPSLIPKAETRAIHKPAQTFLPMTSHPGQPSGLVIVVCWRIKGNSLQ